MSKLLNALTTFLLFIVASSNFSVFTAASKQELNALIAFKKSFPSPSLTDWNSGTDHCSWSYITCDDKGSISSLSFNSNANIRGKIPPSIGAFPNLQILQFENMPDLVGPIPRAITKLKNLQFLDILDSGISGPVPSFIPEIPGLIRLALSNNKLSGPIPYSLGNHMTLSLLDLSGNQLTGTVPPNLFSKAPKNSGPMLSLSDNKLTGVIPRTFGNILFTNLDLSRNNLTGDASFLFGKSKPTEKLYLWSNRLAFELTNLEFPESLRDFSITHNEIYGSIPNQITKVKSGLFFFDVSYNRLCGKIPSGGSFPQLGIDSFTHNKCLCGTPLPLCK